LSWPNEEEGSAPGPRVPGEKRRRKGKRKGERGVGRKSLAQSRKKKRIQSVRNAPEERRIFHPPPHRRKTTSGEFSGEHKMREQTLYPHSITLPRRRQNTERLPPPPSAAGEVKERRRKTHKIIIAGIE